MELIELIKVNTRMINNQEYLLDAIKELSTVLKEAEDEREDIKNVVCESQRRMDRVREDQIDHNRVVDNLALGLKELITQTTNFSSHDQKAFMESAQTLKKVNKFINGTVFLIGAGTVFAIIRGIVDMVK